MTERGAWSRSGHATCFVGRHLAVPTALFAAIYVPRSFGTSVRPVSTVRTKADLPELAQRWESDRLRPVARVD